MDRQLGKPAPAIQHLWWLEGRRGKDEGKQNTLAPLRGAVGVKILLLLT
jgi:hypothetical protein